MVGSPAPSQLVIWSSVVGDRGTPSNLAPQHPWNLEYSTITAATGCIANLGIHPRSF